MLKFPEPGFWTLVLISFEILLILGLLYRHTGLALFRRWLLRLSFLLPLFLYWAHGTSTTSPDPGSVKDLQTYLAWLSRLWVRDAEILAARYIPYLALAIAILAVLPRLTQGIKEFLDTPSGPALNQPSAADPPHPSDSLRS